MSQKPNPFDADVVVAIDDVAAKKFDALAALESQFCEWNPWLFGYLDQVPSGKSERRGYIEKYFTRIFVPLTEKNRAKVQERYGAEKAAAVKLIEAFEVCEYGDQPPPERLRELFPF